MCTVLLDQIVILALVQDQGDAVASLIVGVVGLGIAIVMFAGLWKTFAKAGLSGWSAIIPIYNGYLLCKVAGRSGWWVLLLMIPSVHLIVRIIGSLDIAKNFGPGTAFGLGLAFLPLIFFPILGFSDPRYLGKKPLKSWE